MLKNFDYYEKILSGWNKKEIKIAYNLIKFLNEKNISYDTFFEYTESLSEKAVNDGKLLQSLLLVRQQWFKNNGPICPDCGSFLTIGTVNTGLRDRVSDKSIHSVFSCMNVEGCGFQEFSNQMADVHIGHFEDAFNKYIKGLSDNQILDFEIDDDIKKEFGPLVDKIYPSEFELRIDNRMKLPPCPDCKTDSLGIFSVNTGPSNMVGKKLRTQIYCNNCGWDRFSKKYPGDLMKTIRRRGV